MKRMNVNIPQILSDLSEKSDKLIEDIGKVPPKENEWFERIQDVIQRIIAGTNKENDEDAADSLEFTSKSIPSCLTYIQGGVTQLVPCITSALPDQDRQHVHRKSMKGKKNSAKVKRSHSSRISNQVSRKSSRSSRNVTVVAETNECESSDEALNSSMNKTYLKKNEDTPLNVKKPSKMTLEKELFQKKFKGLHVPEPPHLVVRTSRFSTGKKISGASETAKLSVYGAKISTKTSTAFERKTRLKASANCKEEVVAENIKKMKESKIKMIEEKKRLRSEKMERTKEKRLQLEIAKTECVKQKIKETNSRSSTAKERSGTKRTRSKDTKGSTASKAYSSVKVTSSKPGPKCSKKPRIESSDGEESPTFETPGTSVSKKPTKFESTKVSETPIKGKKKPNAPNKTPKGTETPTKSRRLTPIYQTPKITGTPAKGKKPTPPYKTPKGTKIGAKGKKPTPPCKTPSVTETPASTKQVESSSKRRPTPPMKSESLKVTPTVVKLHASGDASVIGKKTDSLKRLATSPPSSKGSGSAANKLKSENSQAESSGKSGKSKLKPESYDMTPDRSSFTSYDMSEIVSDDDEDDTSHQKQIPSWAVGLRLRNALIHQFYNPPDTDELFGSYLEPPNLEVIFEVQKKAYNKRTSSAVWNSPGMFK